MAILYEDYIKDKKKYNVYTPSQNKTTTSDNITNQNNNGYFKKSKGNIGQTIGYSTLDFFGNLAEGSLRAFEGISDWGRNRGADIVDFFGADEYAKELRERSKEDDTADIVKQWNHITAGDISGTKSEEEIGHFKKVEENSIFGEKSDQVFQGVGNSLTSVGVGALSGGTLATPSFVLSAAGNAETEALNNGATAGEARMYGLISGAIEYGTERLFGGLGKTSEKFGLGKGALDDQAVKLFTKNMKSSLMKNITTLGIKSVGEGLEEVASGIGNAFAQKITYMNEEEIGQLLKDQNLMDSFVNGMLSSALMQSPSTITSTVQGRDVNTGLTRTQQQYVNEIAQQRMVEAQRRNARLNGYEKGKIEDRALTDFQKGRLANASQLQQVNLPGLSNKDMDLQQSAYKYGINPNSEAIVTIDTMLKNRDVIGKFDEDLFKGSNENSLWSRKNGVRYVVFNPNASTDVLLEELAIHELTHDLMSSENSKDVIENQKIMDYVSTLDGYKESRAKVEELYAEQTKKLKSDEEKAAYIDEEIVADTLGKNIGSQEYIRRLIDDEPSIAKNIYDWVVNKVANKNGVKNEKAYWNNVKNNFEKAYNMEYQGKGSKGNAKYSIGGEKGFNNLTEKEKQTVKWFQDKNGDWKFEFTDKDMKLLEDLDDIKPGKEYTLNELFGHNLLTKMYPSLQEYKISFESLGNTNGRHNAEEKTIKINSRNLNYNKLSKNDVINAQKFGMNNYEYAKTQIEGTLLHELQHAIQNIEGFETGRKKGSFRKAYYESLGEIEANDTKLRHILERGGKLDRNKTAPESSKQNPAHRDINGKSSLEEYLKERKKHPTWKILDSLYDKYGTQIDKFREKAYNFFNKEGMSDEEIDLLVEEYQKEILQKDSENTIQNVVRRGSTLKGTSDSSFSMSEQLENQANEVAKKEIAERQAMIELFEDYLSENDITNPTEQDIYNSLDAYDVYDANESFDQEGQEKYFDTIKKYLKEQNQDVRYSLTDNKGRKLTKEQQELFKDSKARDEKGHLLTLYHGTPNDNFTIFENKSVGTGAGLMGLKQKGFYFTDRYESAESYSAVKGINENNGVKEVYLNMTNPLVVDTTTESGKQAIRDMFGLRKNAKVTYNFINKYINKMLYDDAINIRSEEQRQEFFNSTGYDGVILKTDLGTDNEYIVFNSNQIKNVDNTNPTVDADIRYSLSETTATDNQGRTLSKGKQEWSKDSKVRDENGNLITVYHTTTDEVAQFNEFNPVGTDYYRFGDQVVNYYTNSKHMSGSYANQHYEMADTSKFTTVEEVNEWIENNKENEDILYTDIDYKIVPQANGKIGLFIEDVYEVPNSFVKTYTDEEFIKNAKNDILKKYGLKSKLQYEGYLNITNPYVIDAKGSNWDEIVTKVDDFDVRSISNLDSELKEQLTEIAQQSVRQNELGMASLKEKLKRQSKIAMELGGSIQARQVSKEYNELQKEIDELRKKPFFEDTYFTENATELLDRVNNETNAYFNPIDIFKIAKDEFNEETIKQVFSIKSSTNEIVKEVLEKNKNGANYDGVIIKNVMDYGSNEEFDISDSNDVYVTFASNQFKAIDNENPTDDADIRYSQQTEGWQSFLDKNFEAKGTKTRLGDIKLPGLTNTIQEEVQKQTSNALLPIANELKELNKNLTKVMNPNEISQLTPQDASTTPILPGITRNQVGDGKSKFFDNIKDKTNILNDEQKTAILNSEDVKYYDKVTNKDSLDEAYARLQENGTNEVLRWLNNENITSTDVAEGWILLKQYGDSGNAEGMVEVAKKMRQMGSVGGQVIQAFNILSRLTPEGMVKYAQSELLEAYDNMVKNKSAKWIEENRDKFELKPNEVQFIMNTMQEVSMMEDGYDKKFKLAQIQKVLTDKLPPAKGAGMKAWMRISMLFNPKTQVRNVAGNALIAPINAFGDMFASGVDKLVSAKTGVRTTGNTNWKNYAQGMKTGLYQSYNDFKNGVNTRNIEGNRFEVSEGKSFNDNNAIGKALNKVDSLLSFMLDAGDRGFYEASFVNSINNQMVLNNTTEVTQDMIDIATQEALSRTWQDNNEYTKFVMNVRNGLNKLNIGGYGLGDVLIPFAKTPANLTKAIVEYSPVGLIGTINKGIKLNRSLTNGQYSAKTQHEFVQSLGKATAGTMLYILGIALANAGVTTGESDEDKDVSNFMKNTLGVNSYSIKIGDMSFTYDWAQPLAAPLAITANLVQKQKEEASLLENVVSTLDTAGNLLLEQSFMESISTVLNNNEGIATGMQEAILDLPARAIPTFLKQITDLTDGTQRQTFVKDKPIESMFNSIKAKIPGLSYTLDPSVDTLGREIQKYGGKNNLFNVFLNPANVSTENVSESAQEIYRLYKETGETNIMPRVAPYYVNKKGEKIILTTQQRTQYQKVSGAIIEENVAKLLGSTAYKNMSDTKKAETINDIVNYSYNIAQMETLGTELSKDYIKAYEYSQIGDIGEFYEFRNSIDDTNSKTERESVFDYLYNSDLDDNQIAKLYRSCNYSTDKTINAMLELRIPMKEFVKYDTAEIEGKYDPNTGKTISGSKKNAIIEYVNTLNLSKAQRAILIKGTNTFNFNEYNNDIIRYVNTLPGTANEKKVLLKSIGFDAYDDDVFNYINSQNISKEEKIKKLKELGFTVRDGRVYY